jgi:hypothetical protein
LSSFFPQPVQRSRKLCAGFFVSSLDMIRRRHSRRPRHGDQIFAMADDIADLVRTSGLLSSHGAERRKGALGAGSVAVAGLGIRDAKPTPLPL